MSGSGRLTGKRIAVLAADGVEQAELEAALAALKDAGAQAALIALRPGRLRSMNVHQPADLVRVDKTVADAGAADYDGLLIPGGYIAPDLLRQSAQVRDFVCAFDAAGKPIAAMSHAALVLV
ncbi:MAG: DJ-1/PfpI family protein, partial [Telluria sp.]